MKARFWQPQENAYLQCTLCPNYCRIPPDRVGICGVRKNSGGSLDLPFYGRTSALAVDPVEKKPLYHYYPGRTILSVGFLGCSLRCPFCQNYSISQSTTRHTQYVSPEALVDEAKRRGSFAIAYTYNEPTVHFEYVHAAAQAAREAGIKNVLVTAGYVNPEPAAMLLDVIDAANIDLKGFQPEFYRKELRAKLQPVKDFIVHAARRIHVEVTTLVIPGRNDSEQEIEEMASFLAQQNPDIPYHLSAYYPTYTYTEPATPPESVRKLIDVASRHLRYVYPGNVRGNADTHCPSCGATVVARRGYTVELAGLRDGACASCGQDIAVVT